METFYEVRIQFSTKKSAQSFANRLKNDGYKPHIKEVEGGTI